MPLTVQSGHQRTMAVESVRGNCPGGDCPGVPVRGVNVLPSFKVVSLFANTPSLIEDAVLQFVLDSDEELN